MNGAHRAGARPTRRSTARPTQGALRAARNPGREGGVGLDGAIVTSTAILASFGIVMNYSATAALAIGEPFPPLAARHLVGVLAALLCTVAVARLPLAVWRRLAMLLWAATVVLLVATLVAGLVANGARRWLAVPGLPIALQPAEYARFATVLAVAVQLARGMGRRGGPRREELKRVALLTAVPVALLLLQPDLGSAIVLVVVVGLLLFASGVPLRQLVLPALTAALGAAIYVAARPYALARVRGFTNPWEYARDEGFQLVQSFVAFGRGGSFGVGLGHGRQKLFYLPEAHTDFILSVVAEELGLVGVLVVLGCFAALTIAGLRVARRARDPFVLLVAFGMTMLVAVPAVLNAAVVMGLVPTTGLTLPFLSHGSNSLLCAALALGILLRAASREAPPAAACVSGATSRGLARA
jgi:cell division protein FtsW